MSNYVQITERVQSLHGLYRNRSFRSFLHIDGMMKINNPKVCADLPQFSIRISGLRICARLRLAYMKALFRQSVSSIDEISAGAVASRLTANSTTIESGISQQFSLGIQAISFTIGLYVVALIKNAILTLVATVSIPIVLIAYMLAIPFMYKFLQEGEVARDQASSLAFEIFQSVRIVTAFGAERRLQTRHAQIIDRAQNIDRKQAPIVGMMMAPMMLAVYGIFAFTFWYGIKQYAAGRIEGVGTIVM
jgi:ATP-binding cassette, subfamily B (MDR/TAP), member 1